MATWTVTINGKGIRKTGVERLAQLLKEQYGESAQVYVRDGTPPESRKERLDALWNDFEAVKEGVYELKDEMQNWYDNMPQQFQDADKGQEVQAAIDALEELVTELDNVSEPSVEFPRMM